MAYKEHYNYGEDAIKERYPNVNDGRVILQNITAFKPVPKSASYYRITGLQPFHHVTSAVKEMRRHNRQLHRTPEKDMYCKVY